MKKYLLDTESYWALFFQYFLKKVKFRLNVLLYTDYEIKSFQGSEVIPIFYQQLLYTWSKSVISTIPKQCYIWYNKNILVEGKSVFYEEFYKIGIKYVMDLFNRQMRVKPFQYWIDKGLDVRHWLKWLGLIKAIRKKQLYILPI